MSDSASQRLNFFLLCWIIAGLFLHDTTAAADDAAPGSCVELPAWSQSVAYFSGSHVQHNGVKYLAKWWTKGNSPRHSGKTGVWKKLGGCKRSTHTSGSSSNDGCSNIPSYTKATGYRTGSIVQNLGYQYRCDFGTWCSAGEPFTPGRDWAWTSAWTQLDSCH